MGTFKTITSAIVLVTIALTGGSYAATERFEIYPGGDNHIEFLSRAPLETIKGVTDQVEGFIEIDLDNLGNGAEARIEVDMASLDTDNVTRNRHMRENHLATDKFPKGFFALKNIIQPSSTSLKFSQPVNLQVNGELTLRGATRNINASVTAKLSENRDSIYITASFIVPLTDYDIPHPKFLVTKLSDSHEITVKLVAKR
ncbi:YceI family protein [bacterium]|nr:YceI family protein [bacterium]